MKIVIVGSGGRLGAALIREYRGKFDVTGFDHAELDLGDPDQLRAKLGVMEFDVLVNAAAFTNVDLCETQRDQAFRINAEAPRILAEICREKKARLIHFSTDYVFDGEKREPYVEEDAARPISVYGESKREGEKKVCAVSDAHLIVRVSWVFGPDRPSFIDGIIERARENEHVGAIADKFSTPTYTRDIAEMLPQFFAVDAVAGDTVPGSIAVGDRDYKIHPGSNGILHFANAGECSWQEYAQHALDCCHSLGIFLKARKVEPRRLIEMKSWVARRPVYSVLSTAKYISLTSSTPRSWREVVSDYVRNSYSEK